MLIVYTNFEYFKTDVEPAGPNSAAIGVSVTFAILFLAAVVVVLVVLYMMWR